MKSEILFLSTKKTQSLATDEDLLRLKTLQTELLNKENALKTACRNQIRKFAKKKRSQPYSSCGTPSQSSRSCCYAKQKRTGRPRIEDVQPDFLKATVDVATYGGGTDERRRSEKIRAAQTLDELTAALQLMNFNVRRMIFFIKIQKVC